MVHEMEEVVQCPACGYEYVSVSEPSSTIQVVRPVRAATVSLGKLLEQTMSEQHERTCRNCHTVQPMILAKKRRLHQSNRYAVIELPTENCEGSRMQPCRGNIAGFNAAHLALPHFPGESFRVFSAICYDAKKRHYFSFCLQNGKWLKFDCLSDGPAEVCSGLPDGLNGVCLLLIEI